MSTRGNPFEELERLFDRMSRQYEDASRRWGPDVTFGRGERESEPMAIDLVEHDDEFVATVDLPGFEKDHVQVEVTDNTLRIEAEREESAVEDDEQYLRRERRHESARRSIRLPEEVNTENVTARMNNGVLRITLRKLETETARSIDIE